MSPAIIQAQTGQTALVSEILSEAGAWLIGRGIPMWQPEEMSTEAIRADVVAGLYWIAWIEGCAAGVLKFQLDDPIIWPEAAEGDAVYLHRLAVRRQYAGGGVSGALLRWAVARAAVLRRRYVRLDCAADRPALRDIYARFGFRLHSERQIGTFPVARYEYEVV